jgi:hypothetical protein
MPQFDPTVVMVDQLLRMVAYVGLTTAVQCLVVSVFAAVAWLVWRAFRLTS